MPARTAPRRALAELAVALVDHDLGLGRGRRAAAAAAAASGLLREREPRELGQREQLGGQALERVVGEPHELEPAHPRDLRRQALEPVVGEHELAHVGEAREERGRELDELVVGEDEVLDARRQRVGRDLPDRVALEPEPRELRQPPEHARHARQRLGAEQEEDLELGAVRERVGQVGERVAAEVELLEADALPDRARQRAQPAVAQVELRDEVEPRRPLGRAERGAVLHGSAGRAGRRGRRLGRRGGRRPPQHGEPQSEAGRPRDHRRDEQLGSGTSTARVRRRRPRTHQDG